MEVLTHHYKYLFWLDEKCSSGQFVFHLYRPMNDAIFCGRSGAALPEPRIHLLHCWNFSGFSPDFLAVFKPEKSSFEGIAHSPHFTTLSVVVKRERGSRRERFISTSLKSLSILYSCVFAAHYTSTTLDYKMKFSFSSCILQWITQQSRRHQFTELPVQIFTNHVASHQRTSIK